MPANGYIALAKSPLWDNTITVFLIAFCFVVGGKAKAENGL